MARVVSAVLSILACLVLTSEALAQASATLTGDQGEEVRIQADRIEHVRRDDLLLAIGNAEITRGTTRLTADRVEINRETGDAVALGSVVLYDGPDRLVGDRIDYNVKTGTGVVYHGSAFAAPYYRISGERMNRVGEGVYTVRKGVFTTCRGDPPLWSFGVGRGTVDLDDFLFGRDGSFWVGKVPLIPWVPFFAAALRRERQSGFLFPTLGSSSDKGFVARIPYYWAISDSQDATISLDTFSDRGVGGSGEYRYILSEDNHGAAHGFFLREFLEEDDDRGNFALEHTWQVTPRLSLKADISAVSDDDFFREYADELDERSVERAESNLFASYRTESWNLVGNVFWYQDLTQERPVELQRVPELQLQGQRQPVPGVPRLLYEVEGSYVNFIRDVGSDGQRLDLHSRVFLPISVGGFFTVTPFGGGRATYYDSKVVGTRVVRSGGFTVEETEDETRVRGLGETGADVETRVARVFDVGGTMGIARLQHLIEPRVNYTFINGVNKDKLPQYTSGGGVVTPTGLPLTDLGIDAIGKVNQLTYSLTNRLNAKTVAGQNAVRWELMRFLVSQTYDFLADSRPLSDVRGDLIIEPGRYVQFRGDATLNVYGEGIQTINSDISASYRGVSGTVGTRFDDSADVEFVKGEVHARVSRNLDLRGATNYDIESGTIVETRFGVDIHCQCASVSLDYIHRDGEGVAGDEDEFRFSVTLLGVGQVGSRARLGGQ